MHTDLHGLVLMGGKSTRMGRDKATLEYHGVPQWKYVAELLRKYCKEVYWSCSASQKENLPLGEYGLVDKTPDQGPAGGLMTAFAKSVPWLVVACDYPYLKISDLDHLVASRRIDFEATAFRNSKARQPEPLLAIWEIGAQEKLVGAIARGEASPRRELAECKVFLVDAVSANALKNVNSSLGFV